MSEQFKTFSPSGRADIPANAPEELAAISTLELMGTPMTTTPEQRAEWKALCEKASAAPWDMDRERQDDSPDRHYEFAVFDGEGRRLFGTENRDANAGLLEVEYDEDGATVWNELSRRDIAFAVESRTALPALISHIEALEAENARLKEALAWFHHNGKALASDIYSAHRLRGNGASQWMTEAEIIKRSLPIIAFKCAEPME